MQRRAFETKGIDGWVSDEALIGYGRSNVRF